jgi:endonuclease IV
MVWLVGGNKLPLNAKDNFQVAEVANSYGLTAYEIAGGRNIVFTTSSVKELLYSGKQHQVKLSLHGQYATTVLSTPAFDEELVMRFVGKALFYAHHFQAPIVIHPGGKDRQDECQTSDVVTRLRWVLTESGYNLPHFLYLETMDGSNFGTFSQLWKVSEELGTRITVDWTHLWARMTNSHVPYDKKFIRGVIHKLEATDWKDEMYFHLGGAEITPKGEASHQNLEESLFPWQMVLDEIKASSLGGRIIVESNYYFQSDAQLVKEYLEH